MTTSKNRHKGVRFILNDWLNAVLDRLTWAVNVIDYEHHEIHAGSHFFYAEYALNQANEATIDFVVTVADDGKWPHLTWEVSSTDGATIELYVDPTSVTGGTAVTPVNNNGNSDNTAGMTILKDPTIGADGTRVAGYLAGGGRTAGFNSRDREIMLKQARVYLMRITSLAVSNDIGWVAKWYEHTNKETV